MHGGRAGARPVSLHFLLFIPPCGNEKKNLPITMDVIDIDIVFIYRTEQNKELT